LCSFSLEVAIRRRWWVLGISFVVAMMVIVVAILAARVPFSSETLRRRVIAG
jgi:hypothetical protein